MRLSVVAVLLLVLNPVQCDFSEFFKNLSSEFVDAWERLKDAIKQPVRIRRLGQIGTPKRTSPLPTMALGWAPSHTTSQTPPLMTITPTPASRPVVIPLLRRPDFTSLGQWSELQNPYISGMKAQEFMLRGGRGFGLMLERTIFPTPTPSNPTPSRVHVVPVLKLPAFRSLEQWRYMQLPRYSYVTMSSRRLSVNAPTRVAYTLDSWNTEDAHEITKPKRINHDYLSHTLLTENMVTANKRQQNEILFSRLKSMVKSLTAM